MTSLWIKLTINILTVLEQLTGMKIMVGNQPFYSQSSNVIAHFYVYLTHLRLEGNACLTVTNVTQQILCC